jgi:glycosyltransferase involved in cell wall biosynthesis
MFGLDQVRPSPKKVAILHDWCFSKRGGERVLESFLEMFPDADLYMLFGRTHFLEHLGTRKVFFSALNSLPWIEKYYKLLLPVFPFVIESFNLNEYDLVISSSHCVAKGCIPAPGAFHVSYVHSPMRYVWDQRFVYFPFLKSSSTSKWMNLLKLIWGIPFTYLRLWDTLSHVRVNLLISNSEFVSQRVRSFYGRNSRVLFPPVDTKRFQSQLGGPKVNSNRQKSVLLFGEWAPYKKMESALDALLKEGIHVTAAGKGKKLLELSKKYKDHPGLDIVYSPSDQDVVQLYNRCHLLLLPGVEDAGIVPLEAQACGVFVVGPNKGGTLNSVLDDITGFLFESESVSDMILKVKMGLEKPLDPATQEVLRRHVNRLDTTEFKKHFIEIFEHEWSQFKGFKEKNLG